MNVQLSKPELEKYIAEQVRLGNFPTPEAVVEDALLRAMTDGTELTEDDVGAIRTSREQFARGEGVSAAEVKRQMHALREQAVRGHVAP